MKNINEFIIEKLQLNKQSEVYSKSLCWPQTLHAGEIIRNFIKKHSDCTEIINHEGWKLYIISNEYINELKQILLKSDSHGTTYTLECMLIVELSDSTTKDKIERDFENLENYDEIEKYIKSFNK